MRWMLALMVACTSPPIVTLPDGAPDATDAQIDAVCMPAAPTGCCVAMPNEGAVRACAVAEAPVGICGVVVCPAADCATAKIHFCS